MGRSDGTLFTTSRKGCILLSLKSFLLFPLVPAPLKYHNLTVAAVILIDFMPKSLKRSLFLDYFVIKQQRTLLGARCCP